jgi:hypothetical protein
MTERRTARRYDLSLPVTIRVSIEEQAMSQRGQTRDISTAGIYFITGNDLAAGVALDLTMTIPAEVTGGTGVFIRAIGNVARVDKHSSNANQPVGVAAVIKRYVIVCNEAAIEAASH